MNRKLTSQDIARLAGVSQSTVSRVIRRLPNVDDKTREHVLSVIAQHGYAPSAAARSMKTRSNGSVAVVVADLANPLYPTLLHLLVGELAQRGLRTTVWETPGQLDAVTAQAIAESAVDGVIFATAIDATLLHHEAIAVSKPAILMNRSLSTSLFDAVISDNEAGGALVARYFLKAARRRIGLISGHSEASTIKARVAGFLREVERCGGAALLRSTCEFEDFNYENGYKAGRALLQRHADIDALFCTNDILAIGALDGARSTGRRIPEDMWVVGYDDIPMAGWDAISLTTVRQPLETMTSLAVERLCQRMRDPDLPTRTIRLTNTLVTRRSAQ
ncbi:LacI family transcriptional regulator [Allopusillimonas soli]|uniref:LacI family DNA-binding transcriptional regulator n=1 Tax=Allopusillimonas soli TaxID=659016 RepID=A0A853F650_9BURK|nr:LacI family DNA-binding transcriptional regulator [Allopusillimonas soli]NYT36034.1 LacI family DNA-binding transcriptional regulator [Allopusillimonas soli]TEA76375.1 LacI family transcriptional regulator [Allopusillimonas soli]